MIQLYESNNDTYPFAGKCIGEITDAISCAITEEINGIFDLEMECPPNDEIQLYRILTVNLPYMTNRQGFRIYAIDRDVNGVMTVYAHHLSYDHTHTFTQYQAQTTAQMAMLQIHGGSDPMHMSYQFRDYTGYEGEMPRSRRSLRAALYGEGGVLDCFGGELLLDNWNASLLTRRGADNGFVVRYGENLLDSKKTTTSDGNYTQVVGVYLSETDSVKQSVATGIEDVPGSRWLTVDFTDQFPDGAPTAAELRTTIQAYIVENSLDTPVEPTYEIEFVDVEGIFGDADHVALGDTVHIVLYDGEEVEARVTSLTYNALNGLYDSILLGNVEQTIAEDIQQIEARLNKTESMQDFVISEGSQDGWQFRRWNSGKSECWKKVDFGYVAITTKIGSGYIGNTPNSLALPGIFCEAPNVQITPSVSGFFVFSPTSAITQTTIPTITLGRFNSATVNAILSIYVCGRWKS